MLEHAQDLLAWISLHPRGALVLVLLATFLDSLFLVGAFMPAAILLFGVGALIALGSLELWPTTLVVASGALAGDVLSFALGRRYGEHLFESRWLRRYPAFVARGRDFFARHGGKSVLLARFLGPVRSITPALAGASPMSLWLFLTVDFGASLIWALVYLVPGVVFGASLGLAAEVATRLAGLLVLSVSLLVLGVWAARAAIGLFNTHAEHWVRQLLEWSRRHRRLGRFGPVLADPAQPETPALLAVAALLLVVGGMWLIAFGGAGWRDYPGPLDALIFQALSDLSTPWGTATAGFIARLGEWPVYGSTAAAVLTVLLWRRRLRAAAHWVAALSFGLLLTVLLELVPLVPAPAVFFGHLPPGQAALRDLALPTIVYGCGATLFATLRPAQVRLIAYGGATALVLLIGLARLVLGQEWIGLNSFALALGALWIAALTLGYRQHGPERLFAGSFALPVLAAFVLAAGMSWGLDRASTAARVATAVPVPREIPVDDWWAGEWRSLPAARIDLRGRSSRPFDLQWAAPREVVESELAAAGWQPLPALTLADTLRWLTESTPIDKLPVLPLVHAGNHARLTFRRGIDDQSQRLIRLWNSGVRVSGQEVFGEEPVPVWLGAIVEQRARTYYRLFRYPVAEADPPALPPLPGSTAQTVIREAERDGHRIWLIGGRRTLYTAPLADAPDTAPDTAPTPLPAP